MSYKLFFLACWPSAISNIFPTFGGHDIWAADYFSSDASRLYYLILKYDLTLECTAQWFDVNPYPQLPIPTANSLSSPACELYSMNLVHIFTSKTGAVAWRKTTAATASESAAVRILLLFNVVYVVVHVVVIAVVDVVIHCLYWYYFSFIVLWSCIGIMTVFLRILFIIKIIKGPLSSACSLSGFVFVGSHQARAIGPMFVQYWPTV